MTDVSGFWNMIGAAFEVAGSNKLIWIPVMTAWLAGFFYSMYLKARAENRKMLGQRVLRRLELELHVYAMNGGVAFLLYCLFNWSEPYLVTIQQGLLSAVVAVFLPLIWFKLVKPMMGKGG